MEASRLLTIDMRPSGGGPARLGLLDVLGDTLRIDYAVAGGRRPGASRTPRRTGRG